MVKDKNGAWGIAAGLAFIGLASIPSCHAKSAFAAVKISTKAPKSHIIFNGVAAYSPARHGNDGTVSFDPPKPAQEFINRKTGQTYFEPIKDLPGLNPRP